MDKKETEKNFRHIKNDLNHFTSELFRLTIDSEFYHFVAQNAFVTNKKETEKFTKNLLKIFRKKLIALTVFGSDALTVFGSDDARYIYIKEYCNVLNLVLQKKYKNYLKKKKTNHYYFFLASNFFIKNLLNFLKVFGLKNNQRIFHAGDDTIFFLGAVYFLVFDDVARFSQKLTLKKKDLNFFKNFQKNLFKLKKKCIALHLIKTKLLKKK